MSPSILIAQTAARMPFQSTLRAMADWFDVPAGSVENAFWTIMVGALCAIPCALVGCYLLLRRMSLLADALSHSVLAGIGVAYLITGDIQPIPMFIGALVAGLVTAVMTQTLSRYASVPEDSSIGIVFTTLFAIGVVIVSQARGVHLDMDCVLFGDLAFSGMNLQPIMGMLIPEAMKSLVPITLLTVGFLYAFRKELLLTSFDPIHAVTVGISATAVHYLLTTVVAVVAVSAMQSVGLLVVALLIVPAATARLLTQRLIPMMILAVTAGVTSTTLGYLLALQWDTSPAGLTALVAGSLLLLAVVFGPDNGMVSQLRGRLALRLRIAAEDVLAGLYRGFEQPEGAGKSGGNGLPSLSVEECRDLADAFPLPRMALNWLLRRRLVVIEGDRCGLTDHGRLYAQNLVRSHRLWEAYLSKHFDLTEDHLHVPAHQIEHYIGPELQTTLTEDLDEPTIDPHGRTIPENTSGE